MEQIFDTYEPFDWRAQKPQMKEEEEKIYKFITKHIKNNSEAYKKNDVLYHVVRALSRNLSEDVVDYCYDKYGDKNPSLFVRRRYIPQGKTPQKNTPYRQLLKDFIDKKSRKRTQSRYELISRFPFADFKLQAEILDVFFNATQTDRVWVLKQLSSEFGEILFSDKKFAPIWTDKLIERFKTYKESNVARLIVKKLPIDTFMPIIDQLADSIGYYAICMRLAENEDYKIERERLTDAEFLHVCAKFRKELISQKEAASLFWKSIIQEFLTTGRPYFSLKIWDLGQLKCIDTLMKFYEVDISIRERVKDDIDYFEDWMLEAFQIIIAEPKGWRDQQTLYTKDTGLIFIGPDRSDSDIYLDPCISWSGKDNFRMCYYPQKAKVSPEYSCFLSVEPIKTYAKQYLLTEDKHFIGMPTCFTELDRQTLGFRKGEIVLISSQDGETSTAFATSVISNMYGHKESFKNKSIAIFSLAEENIDFAKRMSFCKFKQQSDSLPDYAQERLNQSNIWFYDGREICNFKNVCKEIAAKHGIDCILIDNIQEHKEDSFLPQIKETATELGILIITTIPRSSTEYQQIVQLSDMELCIEKEDAETETNNKRLNIRITKNSHGQCEVSVPFKYDAENMEFKTIYTHNEEDLIFVSSTEPVSSFTDPLFSSDSTNDFDLGTESKPF